MTIDRKIYRDRKQLLVNADKRLLTSLTEPDGEMFTISRDDSVFDKEALTRAVERINKIRATPVIVEVRCSPDVEQQILREVSKPPESDSIFSPMSMNCIPVKVESVLPENTYVMLMSDGSAIVVNMDMATSVHFPSIDEIYKPLKVRRWK